MCGAAADIDGIKAVCDENTISNLIEDSAQALGAFYKGIHVGLNLELAVHFPLTFSKLPLPVKGVYFIHRR